MNVSFAKIGHKFPLMDLDWKKGRGRERERERERSGENNVDLTEREREKDAGRDEKKEEGKERCFRIENVHQIEC